MIRSSEHYHAEEDESHRKTWITLKWDDISKYKVQEHAPRAIKISQPICVIEWKLISWKENKERE